jgi:hypothetical protein
MNFTDNEKLSLRIALIEHLERHGCKAHPSATSALAKLTSPNGPDPYEGVLLEAMKKQAVDGLERWVQGRPRLDGDYTCMLYAGYICQIGTEGWWTTLTMRGQEEAVKRGFIHGAPSTYGAPSPKAGE